LLVATDSSRLKFKIRKTLKIKSSAVAAVNESKILQTLPFDPRDEKIGFCESMV